MDCSLPMMYDLIIIGAGPAGIAASVYAARKRMNFMVVTKDVGGQATLSGAVENYIGYQFITGPELVAKFEEHMKHYNIELREDEEVTSVSRVKDLIHVKTVKGEYLAKTVIVASGKRPRELGVPGEREFKNRGLTYCATCDAPLFSGKDVAVIGGGNSALDAVIQLMRIANRVYLINNRPHLTGDPLMQEKIMSENVVVLNGTQVTAVLGDKLVSGIMIRRDGNEELLKVQGVFVEIGLVPNSEFVEGVVKNEKGEIIVNCYNETNVPGIFAAGDVTNVPEKQIIIAAGEGAKAALSAFRYWARLK